ncbi:MAG: ABC transporter substrate-binding protein, partial [Spirochaetes bacterium]
GLPSPAELKLLNLYRDKLPKEVFTREYNPPVTDGSGNIRPNLRKALKLLNEAGWELKSGKLVNRATGKRFVFELLLVQPSFERIALPFKKNLSRIGIEMNIRIVDSSQYVNRLNDFNFDMVVYTFRQSLSPGNEQRDFWSSKATDTPGSSNLAGIKDPIVDDLIEKVISAPDRESLIAACRALDRVLLWGYYVIPQWHINVYRIAYWNKFARPKIKPKYGLGFLDTWWLLPQYR